MQPMKKHNYFLLLVLTLTFVLTSCADTGSGNDTQQASTVKAKVESPQPMKKQGKADYEVGKDYELLAKSYDTKMPHNVVVYEFFGYTCPHCFHFEPFIEPWAQSKADYVEFVKVPLSFHPSWEIYQQAYLTAKAMGVAEKAHKALFKALHEKNRRFRNIEELAAWYADETGINKGEFVSTAESFIIDAKQMKANGMGAKMQITGTPTVIVNGKYKIKPKKDRQEEIKVLNFLIEKIAKEKGL